MQHIVEIIVIDLNKTFYNKSSKEEFYKFICTKRPKRIAYFFRMAYFKILSKLHAINQTEFKENFFKYLDGLAPAQVESYALEFWKNEFPHNFNKKLLSHLEKMKLRNVQIICATGALNVYVKPLFDIYHIDGFVATDVVYVDNTYKIEGKACKGKEKIKKLDVYYKGMPYKIIEAYSDRKEDLFELAEKSFMVKNGKIIPF